MSDYNQRYLDFTGTFISSLKEIYKQMAGVDIIYKKPFFKEKSNTNIHYSALISINGIFRESEDAEGSPYQGTLAILWPKESYLNLAEAMLMEKYEDIDDEIKDLGMEISNMTIGSAKKFLRPKGYEIEMSIPTSIIGKDHELDSEKDIVTIVVPIESTLGDMFIEVNYKDCPKA